MQPRMFLAVATGIAEVDLLVGMVWLGALGGTLVWTLTAMRGQPAWRTELRRLVLLQVPGVAMVAELGIAYVQTSRPGAPSHVNAFDFVGVLLSCPWVLVGMAILALSLVNSRETRVPRSLVAAHALTWLLTTFVAFRMAMTV